MKLLLVVAVVVLAVWAARTVPPLMKSEHDVIRHTYQDHPDRLQNGQGLWLRHYHSYSLPDTANPKGIMFYAHGLGDHCGRYHEWATLWNNHSLAFFCMDHQGHGQSEGERAYVEDFDHYVTDYLQFIDSVLQRHPHLKHLPRFLSGSSMGGAISMLVANTRPEFFNGVVLLAPLIVPDPRSVAPWQVEAAKLFSDIVPKLGVGALDGHLLAPREVFHSFLGDPLAFKGYVTARWGAEILRAIDTIKDDVATKTTYPFFIIYGTEDVATNMAGAEWLVQNAKSCPDKHSKIYEGWRHSLLHEPDRRILFTDVTEWVLDRL